MVTSTTLTDHLTAGDCRIVGEGDGLGGRASLQPRACAAVPLDRDRSPRPRLGRSCQRLSLRDAVRPPQLQRARLQPRTPRAPSPSTMPTGSLSLRRSFRRVQLNAAALLRRRNCSRLPPRSLLHPSPRPWVLRLRQAARVRHRFGRSPRRQRDCRRGARRSVRPAARLLSSQRPPWRRTHPEPLPSRRRALRRRTATARPPPQPTRGRQRARAQAPAAPSRSPL